MSVIGDSIMFKQLTSYFIPKVEIRVNSFDMNSHYDEYITLEEPEDFKDFQETIVSKYSQTQGFQDIQFMIEKANGTNEKHYKFKYKLTFKRNITFSNG